MLLNKYKYSLNRGLHIRTQLKKKGTEVISFALVSQSNPTLYQISTNGKDTFMLYNDNEYLHRKCSHLTVSPDELIQKVKLHPFDRNNLTLFIANQPNTSQNILLGLQHHELSVIDLAFQNILERKEKSSSIVMSVVGVCNENMLTDELQLNQFQRSYNNHSIRQILRLKNNDHSFNKYQLEGITKFTISNQNQLKQQLKAYKQIKNQKEYLSISEEKYWDWLQGQLFILEEVAPRNQFGQEAVLKSHYILKVNQYLQTSSSLMLNLGIVLRKLQQNDRRGTQSNDSKLFKFLSNIWTTSNLQKVHLFLQIGHQLSLKEEYLALVPTSQISNTLNSGLNVQQMPFCYIKGYQNYPKITSFVSKLNKNNIRREKDSSERRSIQLNGKVKPYARDTFSSIEKRRINSIQMEFEQMQSDHNKDLESIVQEAANLYKQSDPDNFRLSYHKKSNQMVLKRHKKVVERFSTVDKIPSEFYRSEKMRQKDVNRQSLHTKTPKVGMKSEQKDSYNFKLSTRQSAFEIYAQGKRVKNNRKYNSRKEKGDGIDFVDEMLKKEMLVVQKEDLLIFQEGNKVY